jgi:CheY-like chemotaxis protein
MAIRDNFKNAKMLVIEDNPDEAILINDVLRRILPEVAITLVTNEPDALAYLNRCSVEEWDLPKLILLDLYLPDPQNGWRLLERIKGLPAAMGKIPVVLLSRSNHHADITEAYQRGCSSYLIKPLLLTEWQHYFQCLRAYWWETVTLPKVGISIH